MAANDPDRDFRRWLRHGEASALARVFDASANELFALALRLTGSRADAEDLVQTTFLVALEQAGNYDRRRRVIPWLVGILANHARRLRRERGRSLDLERLHSTETTGPDEALERKELSQAVDRALASVPAKYRPIVEARLVGGERSVDLARRLGRSPGVVRVWFQRGLEHFRRALPAEDRLGAALPLLSLERAGEIRSAFVTAAKSVKPVAAGGVVISLGGIVSGKQIVAALGLVALFMTLSWQLGVGRGAIAPRVPSAQEAEVDLIAAHGEDDVRTQELAVPKEPASTRIDTPPVVSTDPSEVDPVSVWLRGRLVPGDRSSEQSQGWFDGLDPREVEIRVRSIGESSYPRGPRTRVRADGSFEVDLTACLPPAGSLPQGKARPYELSVAAIHSALMPDLTQLAVPHRGQVDEQGREWLQMVVPVRPATTIVGRLEFPDSKAERLAMLYLLPRTSAGPESRAAAQALSRGEGFSLRVSAGGRYYLVVLASDLRPLTLPIEVTPGVFLDVGSLSLEHGLAISGWLRWGGVSASEGSWITARHLVSGAREVNIQRQNLLFADGKFERAMLVSQVQADGSFALSGLIAGAYELRSQLLADVTLRDWRPFEQPLVVEAPAEEVILESSSALLRLEFRTEGRLLTESEADGIAVSLAVDGTNGSRQTALIDPDGTVLFQVRPEEAYRISVSARSSGRGELASRRVVAPPAGVEILERLEIQPKRRSDPGTVVVLLDDGQGGFPENAGFVFVVSETGGEEREVLWRNLVGDAGRFQLSEISPGQYTLRIHPGGRIHGRKSMELPIELAVSVEPGETVERTATIHSGAGLRVSACNGVGDLLPAAATLRDSSGAPRTVMFVLYHPTKGSIGSSTHLSDLGVTMVRPPLPPGEYQLEVSWPGLETRTVPVHLRAGETVELKVDLRP